MAGTDIFEMSQRELKRLHIIHKALEGALKQTKAAAIIMERSIKSQENLKVARGT
jgi:hypothetical protein